MLLFLLAEDKGREKGDGVLAGIKRERKGKNLELRVGTKLLELNVKLTDW